MINLASKNQTLFGTEDALAQKENFMEFA